MLDDFTVEIGLRHEYSLSLVFFNITLESVVTKVKNHSIGLKIREVNVVIYTINYIGVPNFTQNRLLNHIFASNL